MMHSRTVKEGDWIARLRKLDEFNFSHGVSPTFNAVDLERKCPKEFSVLYCRKQDEQI